MKTSDCGKTTVYAFLIVLCSIAALTPTPGRAASIQLPACGNDPNQNTRQLQAQINQANPSDTLILPSGTCVLAKCELVPGSSCTGTDGRRHLSALYIGGKSQLSIVGSTNGSILKLDPNPPGTPGRHAYCGDTHLLTVQMSSFITLRGFTMDGSQADLPDRDSDQPCPSGKLDTHLHDLRLVNSTDMTIERMKITQAHGDGINLIAEINQTARPYTERIVIQNNEFSDNKRSGITFQRNVGSVNIRSNHFLDSGNDQDIDMEPTGGAADRGPFNVTIDKNDIERRRGGITVTLGGGKGVKRAERIVFSDNKIRAATGITPAAIEGGCVFVFAANQVKILGNEIAGAESCITIAAQEVNGLLVQKK